jgi:hypothetical protein
MIVDSGDFGPLFSGLVRRPSLPTESRDSQGLSQSRELSLYGVQWDVVTDLGNPISDTALDTGEWRATVREREAIALKDRMIQPPEASLTGLLVFFWTMLLRRCMAKAEPAESKKSKPKKLLKRMFPRIFGFFRTSFLKRRTKRIKPIDPAPEEEDWLDFYHQQYLCGLAAGHQNKFRVQALLAVFAALMSRYVRSCGDGDSVLQGEERW